MFSKRGFVEKRVFKITQIKKGRVLEKTGFCKKPGFVVNWGFVERQYFPITHVFSKNTEFFKPRDSLYKKNTEGEKFYPLQNVLFT